MAQTEAEVLGLELERVRTKVPVLFEREATFFSSIEKKNVEKISRRDMRIPQEIRTGGKFRHYDPGGGDLGRGSAPIYDKAVINTVDLAHAVEWHSEAEWATNDRRKAVLSAFRRNLATAMSEFRRNVDSLAMTDGTGTLATVTTISGADPDVITCTTDGFGVRLLRFDQTVDFFSADLLTQRAGGPYTISLHDLANKTIEISTGPVTAGVATDKIVIDNAPISTTPVSLRGVAYHHDSASTGDWLGYDRALFPEIRANEVVAGGALALPHARLAVNKIGDRLGLNTRQRTVAWMHPAQKQAYEELGQLVQRIDKTPKEESLNLYFGDNMTLAGSPIRESYSWDRTRVDFVNIDIWGRAEMRPAGFYGDEHGRRIFEIRSADGGVNASWIFYIVASFDLFITNPAAAAYISGLSVPAGY